MVRDGEKKSKQAHLSRATQGPSAKLDGNRPNNDPSQMGVCTITLFWSAIAFERGGRASAGGVLTGVRWIVDSH